MFRCKVQKVLLVLLQQETKWEVVILRGISKTTNSIVQAWVSPPDRPSDTKDEVEWFREAISGKSGPGGAASQIFMGKSPKKI